MSHGIRKNADLTAFSEHSFFGGVPILPESAGYGIVLGFGIFFSIFTTTLVRLPLPTYDTPTTGTPTFRLRADQSGGYITVVILRLRNSP